MTDKSEENSREIAVLKYKLEDASDKLNKYQTDTKQQIKDLEAKQQQNDKEIDNLKSQSVYIKGFLKAIVVAGSLIVFIVSMIDKLIPYVAK